MADHVFTAGFMFAGLGAGARGFLDAVAHLGPDAARFRNLGGIDNDALACEDFRRLTGGPALCADLGALTQDDLRAAWGDRAPDCVFSSPPCKSHSGLIGNDLAQTAKYKEMSSLVFKGLFLLLETWPTPPGLIVLENVPRVVSRGAVWLIQVRQLVASYGGVFHEESHDLRKIGDLGAQRRRYLFVARFPTRVPAYVFRPPLKPGKSCGDILGELPLPETPDAGPMHRLPRLSLLNWIRLALIPPCGDWRDLPGTDARARPVASRVELAHEPRRGALGVMDPAEPANTVRGRADVRTGPAAVADGRIAVGGDHRDGAGAERGFAGRLGVAVWDAPATTVRGESYPTNGGGAVSDARVAQAVALGRTAENSGRYAGSPGLFGVGDWKAPLPTVTGSVAVSSSNAVAAVADPRIPLGNAKPAFNDILRVDEWSEPAGAVTGAPKPHGGAAVSDPRIALACGGENTHPNIDRVTEWAEPTGTVTSATRPAGGAPSVADPRIPIGCTPRETSGAYGVRPWTEPALAVTGSACFDNGPHAVADERPRFANVARVTQWDRPIGTVTHAPAPSSGGAAAADPRVTAGADLPPTYRVLALDEALRMLAAGEALARDQVPVIYSPSDHCWHRPLTDLELAALQGLPARIDGAPLELAGKSRAKHRERIGNAVPVGAARAIAETLLTALLAGALGTWTLGATGIWVREDGRNEDELRLDTGESASAA